MIEQSYIVEWRSTHPWSNPQVEQDLIISRAIVEIFSDDLLRNSLAFRGGTALHKLFIMPQIRYSEDIDVEKLLHCYKIYYEYAALKPPTIKQFIRNMEEKLTDPEFTSDIFSVLKPGTEYNTLIAYELVRTKLIEIQQ